MTRIPVAARLYSVLFFLGFALGVVMLLTDKNLQTNFGTVNQGYYFHWYVVLVATLAEAAGALLLLVHPTRRALLGGIVGSGLLALIFVGDIATYSIVGFSSASSFADYLFGIDYYGGNIRYLYDLLLGVYLASFVVGLVAYRLTRPTTQPGTPVPPSGPGSPGA